MPLLRSLLFYLSLGVATLCLPLVMLASLPLRRLARQRLLSRWSSLMVDLLRIFCRLEYRVSGTENIPAGPAIILCKHQSTWETFALQRIFPAQTWVLKRELLLIPIFGWALALAQAIAIDRGSPKQALNQVISKGRDRLEKGLWVVIFPEGTRIPVGEAGKYNAGGAILATRTGYPVVPVAHNAGVFWKPGRLRIRPGTVQLVIGPHLDPTDRKAGQLSAEVEQWIEGAMAAITP